MELYNTDGQIIYVAEVPFAASNPFRLALEAACREGVRLEGLDARNRDLDGADLVSLDAPGADFTGASLVNAMLNHAMLRDACLRDVTAYDVRAIGVDMSGSEVTNADFTRGRFDSAVLDRIRSMNNEPAVFDEANLSDTSMTDCELPGIRAQHAVFSETTLTGTRMNGCDFKHASLYESTLLDISAIHGRFDHTRWPGTLLSGNAEEASFVQADLSGASLLRDESRFDDVLMVGTPGDDAGATPPLPDGNAEAHVCPASY